MKTNTVTCVAVALIGFGVLTCGGAHAATVLFTTQEDFSAWGPANPAEFTLAASATDLDGSATNGLGNLVNAGGAGTGGSLSATWMAGTYDFLYGPGEQGNAAFLAALGSGAGKQIQIDYTIPPAGSGNYFGLGVVLNYNGNFGQFFPLSTVNNGPYWTATYNYVVNPAVLTYFQFGVIYNSNFNTNTPFYIDNIRVIPEPATLGLMSLGGLGLLLAIRRQPR